jgi:hypothetical protein
MIRFVLLVVAKVTKINNSYNYFSDIRRNFLFNDVAFKIVLVNPV